MATVSMPSSRHARITRTAISPRFATSTFRKSRCFIYLLEGSSTQLSRVNKTRSAQRSRRRTKHLEKESSSSLCFIVHFVSFVFAHAIGCKPAWALADRHERLVWTDDLAFPDVD